MSSDEDLPELVHENAEISDDSDEEKWEEIEDNQEEESTMCLFCDLNFPLIEKAFAHLEETHQFDIKDYKAKFSMDFYSYIQMINFIRSNKISNPKDLVSSSTKPLWLDEKYMKPASNHYESWLSYDFDELEIREDQSNNKNHLEKIIEDLKNQLKVKDELVQRAAEDMAVMKDSYRRLITKDESPKPVTNKKKVHENGVASVSLDIDCSYFEGYSHFSIHHSMLSDTVRTESYRDAILKNPIVFKDKDVLDIGCGTSILSLFASRAAKNVYAVDQSDIIYHAMEIAQVNGCSNVKFLKGRLEDIEMPFEKVDVIVSEWMGYLLFFEGMLDSVIYGRNNYLKQGGLMLPNRCNISIVGYGCEERYNSFVKYFENVYGYNMSCMLKDIIKEAHVEKCEDEFVLTKPNVICEIDINTCDLNYSNFTYDFSLEVVKDSKMTSIVGYFDTFFDLPQTNVSFSTSPASIPTHWQQCVFYFDEPVDVRVGQIVTGKFVCQRDKKDLRSLNVCINIFGKIFKYDLN